MTTAREFLAVESIVEPTADERQAESILKTLTGVLKADWDNHPRSLQRSIGPSEVGHPCARQIAAKVAGAQQVNPRGDVLPAWMGVAGHAKLEEAFEADNARILSAPSGPNSRVVTDPVTGEDAGRWIVERRLEIAPGLSGTCDAYDRWTGTVIDHKLPGASTFSKYRKSGPGDIFRTQAHLYGYGYARAGYPVHRVAVWFIPKAATLAKSFVWSEPYDPAIAEAALTRLGQISEAVEVLGAKDNHSALDVIPKTEHSCNYCPFFAQYPSPEGWSCRGHKDRT